MLLFSFQLEAFSSPQVCQMGMSVCQLSLCVKMQDKYVFSKNVVDFIMGGITFKPKSFNIILRFFQCQLKLLWNAD